MSFQPRRSHLACERPFEDKVVEFRVIARPCPIAIKIRRTNRLMRFLGVFGLGLILPRLFRKEGAVITVSYRFSRSRNGAAVHLHAVSPHIGDCAILIELLRNPHGMAGGKAKLARGLLLQRGCCEGRSEEHTSEIQSL